MVKQKLEKARQDLIDTGLRNNPLINFKLPKGKGVAVVECDALSVYQALVIEEKQIPFASIKSKSSRQVLITPHEEAELQKRLLKTHYDARSCIEERGVNVLYLALGMVYWYETPSSTAPYKAPALLVPVTMSRTTATERFAIKFSNEEIEENLSMSARASELGITWPELPEDGDIDLDKFFDSIEAAISPQTGWKLERDEIALSMFSFANMFMYRDLQSDAWCTTEQPEGSPIIAGLLEHGFGAQEATISEDEYIDKYVAPDKIYQVVDSDSSQTLALLDVRDGNHLVIQGPPGTGKSQTITNIIADAIGAGKKVLFVAEKSAALDVVKRRLSNIGLGDACLELHSHSANKRTVLAELQRTQSLGRPRPQKHWSIDNYKHHRDALNDYCLAVNSPIDGTSWTPQQLIGVIASIRARHTATLLPDVRIPVENVRWTRSQLELKQYVVHETAALLNEIGEPRANPFYHSTLQSLMPSDTDRVSVILTECLALSTTVNQTFDRLITTLAVSNLLSLKDQQTLLNVVSLTNDAPVLSGICGDPEQWRRHGSALLSVMKLGYAASQDQELYGKCLRETAWTANNESIYDVFRRKGRSLFRWFSSEYRWAKGEFLNLLQPNQKFNARSATSMLRATVEYQDAEKTAASLQRESAQLLGNHWRGFSTAWRQLLPAVEWTNRFVQREELSSFDQDILSLLSRQDVTSNDITVHHQTIVRNAELLTQKMRELAQVLQASEEFLKEWSSSTISQQHLRVQSMLEKLQLLSNITRWNTRKQKLIAEGMDWLIPIAEERGMAQRLEDVYTYNVLLPLLTSVYQERPLLAQSDGSAMNLTREKFKQLDEDSFTVTRIDLLTKHHVGIPRISDQGQVGILAREYQKKRKHLPIRKLMEQAHNAILAIKPVLMMSPKSIAAFLPPHIVKFDLVIFDEASQIRPVDAFGALLRGKQFVVVGDDKQLPPTNFFNRVIGDDTDDEDVENVTSDVESLLGLASSRGVRDRMLRWHYRSRHQSLISLSNELFYNNRLVVFPSPKNADGKLGLVMHHNPESVYDRGKSKTNAIEAEQVARAVIEHARAMPEKTLGVATLNAAQADAILAQLERYRREHPEIEHFFQAHPEEPFFCKNLENVQGDERDVIFISIGYGRDKDRVMSMSFGAVNQEGGERRLNVLITRARESCHVFSNITYHDIDDSRSKSVGLRSLKAFLRYAHHGVSDIPTSGVEDTESPFEDEVSRALCARGYDVAHQVGSGGFRVDIAIRNPDNPSSYLLGIECDGASYHRSRSTRDRDRLRQQVLENLGWRIHRIWSTDWFKEPERELRRIEEAIADIEQTSRSHSRSQTTASAVEREEPRLNPDQPLAITGKPYEMAKLKIRLRNKEVSDVTIIERSGWVEDVVDAEAPIHIDDVKRRILEAAKVSRMGPRISESLDDAIAYSVREGFIAKRGEFLYVSEGAHIEPRDRSEYEQLAKRLDKIAPEEIDAAIVLVVREAYGATMDQIATAVCRVFGFKRTSEEASSIVSQRCASLERAGVIRVQNGMIQLR